MIHCPGSFCLVNSGGFVHLVALSLVDVALCDCQYYRISRLYRDAQDKKQQCHAHHEAQPKSVQTIIINVVMITNIDNQYCSYDYYYCY